VVNGIAAYSACAATPPQFHRPPGVQGDLWRLLRGLGCACQVPAAQRRSRQMHAKAGWRSPA